MTIIRVIDGDTMEARFPNGEVDTLRLLGVDTPETTLSRVSPEEYEGIPETAAGRDHLFNWGERATSYAQTQLAGEEVRVEVDPDADRRGSFGRLLVYIYVDGENFNKQLLETGRARLYESTFSKRAAFEQAEQTARQNAVGLWDYDAPTTTTTTTTTTMTSTTTTTTTATTTTTTTTASNSQLAVDAVHADAEGNDHENENDEWVRFKNTGDTTLDISGWTIRDAADHTYTVPAGTTIEPGATITLYTGSGTDTETELYWGSDAAIWNNDGDTIIVTTDTGEQVLEYEY